MKYIRTKDRIREIIEDFGGSCNVKSIFPRGRPSIDNFTVVSGVRFAPRANTIEELCDEFVVIRDSQIPIPFANLEQVRLNRGNYGYSNSKVYGAIWTDKGLIYVAKMNDKGGLELL